jgi:hypothetical protein
VTDVLEVSSLSEALVASKWCKALVYFALGCANPPPLPHVPFGSSRIAFYCFLRPLLLMSSSTPSPPYHLPFFFFAWGGVILLRRILPVVMVK